MLSLFGDVITMLQRHCRQLGPGVSGCQLNAMQLLLRTVRVLINNASLLDGWRAGGMVGYSDDRATKRRRRPTCMPSVVLAPCVLFVTSVRRPHDAQFFAN